MSKPIWWCQHSTVKTLIYIYIYMINYKYIFIIGFTPPRYVVYICLINVYNHLPPGLNSINKLKSWKCRLIKYFYSVHFNRQFFLIIIYILLFSSIVLIGRSRNSYLFSWLVKNGFKWTTKISLFDHINDLIRPHKWV